MSIKNCADNAEGERGMTVRENVKQLPDVAPKGFYFYIATTPNPTDKGRRYLHTIHRPQEAFGGVRVTLSPTRSLAKPFDQLALARAYADFLNRADDLDDFCVVLEAGTVLDRPSVPMIPQRGEPRRKIKTYSKFTWK
jgi:hypothetical protein